MLILGIETSCDETSASIIKDGTQILSNVVASSQELHIKTGGIIPEMAAREQIKCMMPVIQTAIEQSNNQTIDALAVTVGPGLIGSLLVGVETAKTLAYLWNKPIIPVNHLLAHVYANWLNTGKSVKQLNSKTVISKTVKNNTDITDYRFTALQSYCSTEKPRFPVIALIVSGGHTELLLMQNHGDYKVLGGTRDDAAGEAFDKIARLLGLGYPGGPAIATAAAQIRNPKSEIRKIKLPRPMIDSKDFDFSFSGLKTAVLREINKYKNYNNYNEQGEINRRSSLIYLRYNDYKIYLAYEVQEAITDVLVEKAVRAAQENNVKQILLSGGVSANQRLREKFTATIQQFNNLTIFTPPPSLCTDNAAAIAGCAFFNYKPVSWKEIKTNPSLSL